jgi:hypothetical protein
MPLEVGTVGPMTNSMALKARADLIAQNIRGKRDLQPLALQSRGLQPLADVIPLTSPTHVPALRFPPTTRRIDTKGRFHVTLDRCDLATLLGWAPGSLSGVRDGQWLVLSPDAGDGPARRHDSRAALCPDGRVRLSAANRFVLGVEPGDEVAVLVVPEQSALALCNPALLLAAAPLEIFDRSKEMS